MKRWAEGQWHAAEGTRGYTLPGEGVGHFLILVIQLFVCLKSVKAGNGEV